MGTSKNHSYFKNYLIVKIVNLYINLIYLVYNLFLLAISNLYVTYCIY